MECVAVRGLGREASKADRFLSCSLLSTDPTHVHVAVVCGRRLAAHWSSWQPVGCGTVRRIRTAPTHQHENLRAKPPRPNGPGNGRFDTRRIPALYAGCCSPCREVSLLQQESTEEAGQRQRNSDHAPANHVLKSGGALNAGRGVVCLDLVDLRFQSGGAHISSCSGRWVWDATRSRRCRDMTPMQVCREAGSRATVAKRPYAAGPLGGGNPQLPAHSVEGSRLGPFYSEGTGRLFT
jgi:hypothetical protein